jgi:hypothetical protein
MNKTLDTIAAQTEALRVNFDLKTSHAIASPVTQPTSNLIRITTATKPVVSNIEVSP